MYAVSGFSTYRESHDQGSVARVADRLGKARQRSGGLLSLLLLPLLPVVEVSGSLSLPSVSLRRHLPGYDLGQAFSQRSNHRGALSLPEVGGVVRSHSSKWVNTGMTTVVTGNKYIYTARGNYFLGGKSACALSPPIDLLGPPPRRPRPGLQPANQSSLPSHVHFSQDGQGLTALHKDVRIWHF